jgi:hypothetical protein
MPGNVLDLGKKIYELNKCGPAFMGGGRTKTRNQQKTPLGCRWPQLIFIYKVFWEHSHAICLAVA